MIHKDDSGLGGHPTLNTMGRMSIKKGRIAILLCFVFSSYFWFKPINDKILNPVDVFYYLNPNRPKFSCTVYQGGLGNLLFQYSFSYMLSKTLNLTLLVPQDKLNLLQEVFQIPDIESNEQGMKICRFSHKYEDSVDCGFDPSVLKVPNNSDIHYEGYFQSWVYWAEYDKEIRDQLKFRPEIINKAQKILINSLESRNKSRSDVSLVGIHVRRGDMITMEYFRNYGYQVADEKYLANAMSYLKSRIKKEIFYIICSNDLEWTKAAIKVPNAIFMTGTSRGIDMAMLTMCDHIITTVGTFGWWTGFLSKGIVIYYNKPFRPKSDLAKNFAEDYNKTFFYPGWIGLS